MDSSPQGCSSYQEPVLARGPHGRYLPPGYIHHVRSSMGCRVDICSNMDLYGLQGEKPMSPWSSPNVAEESLLTPVECSPLLLHCGRSISELAENGSAQHGDSFWQLLIKVTSAAHTHLCKQNPATYQVFILTTNFPSPEKKNIWL